MRHCTCLLRRECLSCLPLARACCPACAICVLTSSMCTAPAPGSQQRFLGSLLQGTSGLALRMPPRASVRQLNYAWACAWPLHGRSSLQYARRRRS